MINDFPPFIDGELLFGYIYRYHIYSGNLHFRETAQDIWGNMNKWVTSIYFPLVAKDFIDAIGMSEHDYIVKHTVIPFYRLFIDKDRYDLILSEILSNNLYCLKKLFKGMKINFNSKSIQFCPLCTQENYNMPVIVREHNIDGVYVCVKHKCFLNIKTWEDSRKRNKFFCSDVDMQVRYTENALLLGVAEDVKYILNNELQLGVCTLRRILFDKIKDYGYFHGNDYQLQRNMQIFRADFKDVPKEYKELIQYLTFKKVSFESLPKFSLHPLNYILVIRQLFGSFEKFIYQCGILP